jgi:hypothetical protein
MGIALRFYNLINVQFKRIQLESHMLFWLKYIRDTQLHRDIYGIIRGELFLLIFLNNCGYSLILHQNSTTSFLKVSCHRGIWKFISELFHSIKNPLISPWDLSSKPYSEKLWEPLVYLTTWTFWKAPLLDTSPAHQHAAEGLSVPFPSCPSEYYEDVY